MDVLNKVRRRFTKNDYTVKGYEKDFGWRLVGAHARSFGSDEKILAYLISKVPAESEMRARSSSVGNGARTGMMDQKGGDGDKTDRNDTKTTLLLLLGLTVISIFWIVVIFVLVFCLSLWLGDSWEAIWLFSGVATP
jgi:hypothetical protein